MAKVKRTDLSNTEKVKIIEAYDKLNPSLRSFRLAAIELNVSKTQLHTIIKGRNLILKRQYENRSINCKRLKDGSFKKVDDILLEWFEKVRARNQIVTNRIAFFVKRQ